MGLHTVSVEDMTAGKNEWRNIQDIVRVTFKEFHDVLRAQGDADGSLERAIDSKADRGELGRGLSRSQLPEVEAALRQLKHISSDIGHQLDLRATKADVHAAFKAQEELIGRELARKADAEEVERKVNEMDALLAECVERAGVSREGYAIAPRSMSIKPGTERPRLGEGGERDMEELWEEILRKADADDVDAALRSKADASSVNKALERLEISARTGDEGGGGGEERHEGRLRPGGCQGWHRRRQPRARRGEAASWSSRLRRRTWRRTSSPRH